MPEWTVNDMYKYAKAEAEKPLLSAYPAEFWSEYRTNYTRYDKLFNRYFSSFRYFNQDNDTIEDCTDDFIDEVYHHLMINDKKYSELYKINILQVDTPIYDNFHITNMMYRDKTINRDYTSGARTDTTSDSTGQRTDTTTNKTSGFNSTDFVNDTETTDVKGAELDNNTYIKGSQTDDDDTTINDDYIFTSQGSKGEKGIADNISDYQKLWSKYRFYDYIFDQISKELLLV